MIEDEAGLAFEGRVAVVTGAGEGIGRATALRLSRAGARLALMGRTEASLERTAGELPSEALTLAVDVGDQPAVEQAFRRVAEVWGEAHALVVSAGVAGANRPGPEDRWREILRTNLDGAYYTFRGFESICAAGPEPRHAIAISSCVARFGIPEGSAYSASKAGLLGLVRSLAIDWAPRQILVNSICPGWVDTRMARQRMEEMAAEEGLDFESMRASLLEGLPLPRMSEPEEIAELVAFLLGPGGRSFTGQSFDPNNGAWMG